MTFSLVATVQRPIHISAKNIIHDKMNGVAHYLVGLIIMLMIVQLTQKNTTSFSLSPSITALIVILAFFSHIIIDALAHYTYHPSQSNWGDPIYTGWHLLTYIAEAGFAIYFLRTDIRYAIAMISSVGFDLWDWSIARPLSKYAGIDLPNIHWMASSTEQFLFGWGQSWRNEQWALIIEVIFVIFAFIIWKKWHEKSIIENNDKPASWKQISGLIMIFGTLRLLTLI